MSAAPDDLARLHAAADFDGLADELRAPDAPRTTDEDSDGHADAAADSGNNRNSGNHPGRTRRRGRSRSKRAAGTAETGSGNTASAAGGPEAADEPPEAAPAMRAGFPALDERPCFRVYDDAAQDAERPGLWFHGVRQGKGEAPPAAVDAMRMPLTE